mmetsp:Transcript_1783/g.1998  ORF Transcript_1783/g.1998 Transcript_1783/m.1998 type:complete len:670 (-) Transcript_1783:236-2245(-)
MAASIKMDELLVTWLSSDNVYENVLNLIETYRQTASQPNNKSNTSPPSSPSRARKGGAIDDDEKDSSSISAAQKSKDVTIPPFYRPPGSLVNGKKAKPLRRSRSDSFDSDQSWDGVYSADGNDDYSQSTSHSNNSNTDSKKSKSNNNTASNLSIKEQVKKTFDESGKPMELNKNSKYLTIDNFVKITKDICTFPTFFNRPLYKRILYLWNTQDIKSQSGKLIIWNEYLNEDLDIGSNPAEDDSSNNEQDGENKTNTKKKEPNELLDQLDKYITYDIFKWYWSHEMEDYDIQERFYRLLKKPHEDYVGKDDFGPYIKELLRDHPGLEFLSNHAEFQDKYAVTVITRIFYTVNKCHSGRITSRQIRRSDLLSAFQQVDEEEDINKVTKYFSYEHFYVLYCRFWELDHDRDYKITREDLLKYADQSLSHMIADRIFDAAPRPFGLQEEEKDNDRDSPTNDSADGSDSSKNSKTKNKSKNGKVKSARDYLTYEDFIFFMLSEEDKANEISVRYWFSCLDVDGDGKLNNMEMRSFYALQQHRMQTLGHEHIPFEDMLCQMIDMIKPKSDDHVIVEDFLQEECVPVSGALFDALFNLNKYVQFEQRDPFQERQKREDEFETDWDRFACMDYNRLAMEEEAREEDAMEIDWVTVDDEDEDGEDFNLGLGGSSEAPF